MIFKILLYRSVQTPNSDKNWQTSCPLQTFVCNISRHLEFIIEQGHRVNWVSSIPGSQNVIQFHVCYTQAQCAYHRLWEKNTRHGLSKNCNKFKNFKKFYNFFRRSKRQGISLPKNLSIVTPSRAKFPKRKHGEKLSKLCSD